MAMLNCCIRRTREISSSEHGIYAEFLAAVYQLDLKNTRDYVNQSGLSRAAIFNSVEASLARLDTSYIDVLQIHRYDPEVTAEETMKVCCRPMFENIC